MRWVVVLLAIALFTTSCGLFGNEETPESSNSAAADPEDAAGLFETDSTPVPLIVPDDEEYLALAADLVSRSIEATRNVDLLLQDTDLESETWARHFFDETAVWLEINDQIRATTPPERFREFHETFAEMGRLFAYAADELQRGVENSDPSAINSGMALVREADEVAAVAATLLPAGN